MARIMAGQDQDAQAARERGDREIHEFSAWILRGGVILSVAVMLGGLVLGFLREPPSVAQMSHRSFNADFQAIAAGAARGEGFAWIELGILFLVLTPILRVATSFVIFVVHERDKFYAAVTFLVLGLTLLSLFALK